MSIVTRTVLGAVLLASCGVLPSCSDDALPQTAQVSTPDANDPIAVSARAQAKRCADAMIARDYSTVVELTHPKVVEMVGGQTKMIRLLGDGNRQMNGDGMSFESATVSAPTAKAVGKSRTYVIVPQQIILKTPTGRIQQDSFLLGTTTDDGQTWKFVDGSGLNSETANKVFDDFPAELQLPPKQSPKTLAN
jgi:hypothetical protein